MLDWLLDHGADINRTDETRTDFCRSPWGLIDRSLKVLNIVAARRNIQLLDHLVCRGADLQRSMALHGATKCPDADKSVAMIDHLLDRYHMNIEADDREFRPNMIQGLADTGTPLNCAVCFQNLAAVKHLLKRGANPLGRFEYPISQSIGACLWGPEEFLPAQQPLLEAGAKADLALSIAIREDRLEAAKICVAAGADPRLAISDQEARAARLTARSEQGLGEDDPWDGYEPWDHVKGAEWNHEMEAFLRSAAADH